MIDKKVETDSLFLKVQEFAKALGELVHKEVPIVHLDISHNNLPKEDCEIISENFKENHSIIGGLGSAICEALSENYPCKVFRIGVNDEFGQSGEAGQLLEYYGLNSVNLAKTISQKLKEMK